MAKRAPYIKSADIVVLGPHDLSGYVKPKRGRKPIDDSEHIAKALSDGYNTADEAAYGIAQSAIDCTKEPKRYNALYCRLRVKLKPHF